MAQWSTRECEICGKLGSFHILGKREIVVRQRYSSFEWIHYDAVCKQCGLIQGSQVPDEDFLMAYYADAYTTDSTVKLASKSPGFDADARLSTIQKYLSDGSILEIGANDGVFCEILREHGYTAYGLDPLGTHDSSFVKHGFVSGESIDMNSLFDMVVSYHVIEHVSCISSWLDGIRSVLRLGGLIVLETPDVEKWPLDAWHHEHLIQFTPYHLQVLMESEGFTTVSCNQEQESRSHGMVYVGRLAGPTNYQISLLYREPAAHVALAETLYERVAKIHEKQSFAAADVAKQALAEAVKRDIRKSEIVIWGANEIATAIGYSLSLIVNEVVVKLVDNADSKIGMSHPGYVEPVRHPVFLAEDELFRIFVLCSRNWNSEIASQIKQMGLENFTIIDGAKCWPSK